MTYTKEGNIYFRSGSFGECLLRKASNVSSQRTIFPSINITGIVGNPMSNTNGSACSITVKASLCPTTCNNTIQNL